MLWTAKRCSHGTFARVARRIGLSKESRSHMVRDRTALFKPERSPLFFYREDPATQACAEHVHCRGFHLSRPRRTASHLCSISVNPAPLTCSERASTRVESPPERTFQDLAESAGATPPWSLYRRAKRVAHCRQRSQGPMCEKSGPLRVGIRFLTQARRPHSGSVRRWRAATRHGTTFRHPPVEGR